MSKFLYTHHHYGWIRHNFADSQYDNLVKALLETHDFLQNYEGKYQVEVKQTPDASFMGHVTVIWDSDDPCPGSGPGLFAVHRGDRWFKAFEYNVASENACRYCGGTGKDHYTVIGNCWACLGSGIHKK